MNPAKTDLHQRRSELLAIIWQQVTIRARPDYDQIFQTAQSIRRVGRKDLTRRLKDRHQKKIDAASPETVRLARKLHSLESAVYRKKAQIKKLKEREAKNERLGTAHTLQTA